MWIVIGPGTKPQSNALASSAETTTWRSASVPPSKTWLSRAPAVAGGTARATVAARAAAPLSTSTPPQAELSGRYLDVATSVEARCCDRGNDADPELAPPGRQHYAPMDRAGEPLLHGALR